MFDDASLNRLLENETLPVSCSGWVTGGANVCQFLSTVSFTLTNICRIRELPKLVLRSWLRAEVRSKRPIPVSLQLRPLDLDPWSESSPGKWQAAKWPGLVSASGGVTSAQTWRAIGQRVRKRQPDGGSTALGGSPVEPDALARALGRDLGHRHRNFLVGGI